MYSFEPDEEQLMLVDAIQRYAETDLRKKAHDSDEERAIPKNLIEKGWELGYLQASIPESYGGYGQHQAVCGVLAAEEFAWGDLAGAISIFAPALLAVPILLGGTEQQKQEYLPPIVEGNWVPYSSALIEAQFDFDPNHLRTTAIENRNKYILNGNKIYVPFADEAPVSIVYANLEGKTQGFILPKDTPGVAVGQRMKLLGIHALPVYELELNNVAIPHTDRIGGQAGHDFGMVLNYFWVAIASMAVGIARAAFEYSRDYAKEREVFGVKVAQKQAIAFMLAEMATEIESIRMLVWEAAWMLDNNKSDASKAAYLAFTGAGDMAMMVTDRAVQILGGYGYIREYPVEMWMRNGRGFVLLNGLVIV